MPTSSSPALLAGLVLAVGCGDNLDVEDPPQPDASDVCDPATVLPSNFRPIAAVSAGAVTVLTADGITSGTLDATAGGITASANNPYLYVDLGGAAKVAIDDLAAPASTAWDIALKRSSLRVNGGDSGAGGRKLAVLEVPTLAEVTAAPASGFAEDDFADDNCQLKTIPGGEPSSAFGDWYNYDRDTHAVTPKAQVYVIERGDGTRFALRLDAYNGDPENPMRGAFYRVEWKTL